MKKIELTFINRVKLSGILNGATGKNGGLDKLHALLEIYGAVRFTEEELGKMTLSDIAPGVVNYIIRKEFEPGDFCNKTVDIEDQQAKWLLKELDAWVENATISDVSWLNKLKGELK